MRRQIVMVGTGLDTRGGISAVVRVYAEQGLFEREQVRYIATHGDGSRWRKLQLAVCAWCVYMGLLVTGRVKIVHVHSASGPSFWRKCAFMLPSFLFRVPVVLHMHGGGFASFYARGELPGRRRFIAWVFRKATRVVALSDQWRDALQALFPDAVIVIVPNPIQVPAEPAPLNDPPPSVLFLGAWTESKGVFDLLSAWATVQRAMPQARLQLGGAGDEQALKAFARQQGVEGTVDWLGWISADDKRQALRRAWLLVLPSHAEALPMAVLEAMAAGLPIVATRVGGIPHAVRHGVDGLLVAPRDVAGLADALLAVLADEPRRRAMGTSGRQRVRDHFAADVVVPQVQALWSDLLDGSLRRSAT
ncbi:glycosyltransferase family 4 protein [Ideonella sp. BN130291]|uniref:glycosyltransferase family 4 protein n=1 Tax=Ideonella sp. BN130291 TaxID=3112940 RepID=UPI002E26BDFB|nr:glycosyltransferase family 4 protein [Ideonella sp. BN130291]